MILSSERIAETIAHFIGYFHGQTEDLRARESYEEFYHAKARALEHPDLVPNTPSFDAPFDRHSVQADVSYKPVPTPVVELDVSPKVTPVAIPIHLSAQFQAEHLPHAGLSGHYFAAPALAFGPLLASPPGSAILVTQQTLVLADNDVVVTGTPGLPVEAQYGDLARFEHLASDGESVAAPLGTAGPIGSFETVQDVFTDARDLAQAPPAPLATTLGDTTWHVAAGAETAGITVNGETASALPSLAETLKHAPAVEAPPPKPVAEVSIHPDEMPVSMTVAAGGNESINSVGLLDAGLTGTVLAVRGDVHQVDAIIQTNAWSDVDSISQLLPGMGLSPVAAAGAAGHAADATTAFNIASFSTHLPANASGPAVDAASAMFPQNWHVSVVQGDMAFVNYVHQYQFVTDFDTHVLTAVGTTTTITTGENIGLNGVSFADLGRHYDLVMINGNYYDGNVIAQTNILYDDDTVNALGRLSNASGSVATSGNLLWNQASIENIGTPSWQQGVPAAYSQAMDGIGSGNLGMPGSMSSDANFAGHPVLNVLYIGGNLFNLNYVSQTNVMGDADAVSIHEQQVQAQGQQWNIQTGGNTLVNAATIIDYDTAAKVASANGNIYSDAILIQANIIASDPAHAQPAAGSGLANEVIAFLDDDDAPSAHHAAIAGQHDMPLASDGPSLDSMHSLLS